MPDLITSHGTVEDQPTPAELRRLNAHRNKRGFLDADDFRAEMAEAEARLRERRTDAEKSGDLTDDELARLAELEKFLEKASQRTSAARQALAAAVEAEERSRRDRMDRDGDYHTTTGGSPAVDKARRDLDRASIAEGDVLVDANTARQSIAAASRARRAQAEVEA